MGIALEHLSEAERERIARSLFTVTSSQVDSKGELHGLCPIHGEKNPSFSYNIRTDVYNCFSCEASGDLVRLWSIVRGITDEREGFKSFCKEFDITLAPLGDRRSQGNVEGRSPGKEEEKDPPEDLERVWELFPPLPYDRIDQLEKTRGWNRRQIAMLDLRLQTHFVEKKSGKLRKLTTGGGIAIPIRDSKGRLANIRIYKPGEKKFKIVSWASGTGEARLLPPAPLLDGQPVLLCEGESDCICALSHGFNAITQTTKPKTWKARQIEVFRGRDVIIAYDADQPGQKYMGYAAKALEGVAKSIRCLMWPDYMGRLPDGTWPKDHGEDLTDFFVKYGKKPSDLAELMASAKSVQDEDSPLGVMQFFDRGVNDRLSFKPRILAERIMRDNRLLFEEATGLLYRWNGRVWVVYEESLIAGQALRYLENEADKARAENVVYQVKKLNAIPDGRKVNDRTDWVCIANGLLNLRTLEIKPHDPEFFCTFFLPVEFDPESSKVCDRFLKYLEETIQEEEVGAQLQEYAGYCLTHSTQYEKCLLLLGPGADGKSTFLKILRELVGPENCASVSFNDLDDQFQRSSLYGKLLNISTEVGSKAIESPYFKAITSGDPLNAAFKHKNTFTFSPTCKLAFAANRLPRVQDNSDGYFRRLLPIKFKRQFLDDADPGLFEKLKSEISEIFHWAITGLHRLWDQNGFTNSPETRQIIMEYRRSNNPVLCYVEDECTVEESQEVSKKELYNHYRQYCVTNGYSPFSRENFFRELYLAISNLKQYRPRFQGARENKIKGLGIANAE